MQPNFYLDDDAEQSGGPKRHKLSDSLIIHSIFSNLILFSIIMIVHPCKKDLISYIYSYIYVRFYWL